MNVYHAFVNAIAQTLRALAQQAQQTKATVGPMMFQWGINNIRAVIKQDNDTVIIGIAFDFVDESKARKFFDDVTKVLGIRTKAEEK